MPANDQPVAPATTNTVIRPERCENCKAAVKGEIPQLPEALTCHGAPPSVQLNIAKMPNGQMAQQIMVQFPPVEPHFWCLQWRPRVFS